MSIPSLNAIAPLHQRDITSPETRSPLSVKAISLHSHSFTERDRPSPHKCDRPSTSHHLTERDRLSNISLWLPAIVDKYLSAQTHIISIMQITLSSQQSQVLETLSQQGGYASLTDAIDQALLLLADEVEQQKSTDNAEYLAWVEQTRLKVEEGIKAADQGELLDADVVLAQLRQKVTTAKEQSM